MATFGYHASHEQHAPSELLGGDALADWRTRADEFIEVFAERVLPALRGAR